MSVPNTHFGAAKIAEMLRGARRIHFIGIGGVNMSALAEITFENGLSVTGSDRVRTAATERLEALGITVFYSHASGNVAEADAVVYTVAISDTNPEYRAAITSGIPLISRADYLGYLMTSRPVRIGVSGMHGKSTTTAMCASAFTRAKADPTVLCGAEMPEFGSTFVTGNGDCFIFEACEYMDSFLDFNPTVAVILNIENDHVDYFKNITQIRRSFADFASLTGPDGICVVNADDANVKTAMSGIRALTLTFSGREKADPDDPDHADFYPASIDLSRGYPSFDVVSHGTLVAHIDLSVPGRHNVYNAIAALASGIACGLDPALLAEGISGFTGAARRMEFKGKFAGADVYEDYGHHPTEISATIKGCREMGYRRVFCVFQPHTYSRTNSLFDDFAAALSCADEVILADIYAAREMETFGVSSEKLAEAVGERAVRLPDWQSMADRLGERLTAGDALIVMGAGDVYHIFPYLGLSEKGGA
ncbi:MAG: UDP-N-acetylmuramate--L-alanine ligase [Clostridia bacterium]|nr:UDP-N-acetylmuramate--L-alanine ligase [Clostridia bacterium]